MATCPHCQATVSTGFKRCPACGGELSPEGRPGAPGFNKEAALDTARQVKGQAVEFAKDAWARAKAAGLAKVGLGLMAGSAVFLVWKSQRGLWDAGWRELIPMLLILGYMGAREFMGNDPLAQYWWAGPAGAGYLLLWSLTGLSLRLGSVAFIAGAVLLAIAVLQPWYPYVKSLGFDWRYSLYGYRRAVALGAILAFLALFITWTPAVQTAGYFSGGYSYNYSSYYQQNVYQWDYTKYYNPGLYFPSSKGIGKAGAVLMELALLGSLFYAAFAPQFAVPKWYRFVPLIAAGYGAFFLITNGSFYWGELFFLAGAGLVAWGGYQLGVKGTAEGPGDLHQVPLERWLARWM